MIFCFLAGAIPRNGAGAAFASHPRSVQLGQGRGPNGTRSVPDTLTNYLEGLIGLKPEGVGVLARGSFASWTSL
jgi:hypothetical protein